MTINSFEDSNVSLDLINVNMGKRIRLECELTNLTTNFNQKVNQIRRFDQDFSSLDVFRVYGYV